METTAILGLILLGAICLFLQKKRSLRRRTVTTAPSDVPPPSSPTASLSSTQKQPQELVRDQALTPTTRGTIATTSTSDSATAITNTSNEPNASTERDSTSVNLGLVLIVDVETTGSRSNDEIVEFAAALVEYDRDKQRLLRVRDRYCGLRQPSVPIDPHAFAVHGISDDLVEGHSLDEERIRKLIHASDFIVAHNARFDRKYCTKLISSAGEKDWKCSLGEIDWASEGVSGRGLETILHHFGLADSVTHRAEPDVNHLLAVLSQSGRDGHCMFAKLLAGNRADREIQQMPAAQRRLSATEYFSQLCPGGLLSREQTAVFDAIGKGSPNLSVDAVAGSAKTTTLMATVCAASTRVKVLAYNRAVAEGWNARLVQAGINGKARARTFHSFAFESYSKRYPDVQTIEAIEKIKLVESTADELESQFYIEVIEAMQAEGFGITAEISQTDLKTLLKRRGSLQPPFLKDESSNHFRTRVDQILARMPDLFKRWNALNSKFLTYSDTLYAAVAENSLSALYGMVACDESQDTNKILRLLLAKIVARSGQLVFFGDRHQAIYWFAGADTDSIDQIVKSCHTRELRLSISFRCAHAIVEEARRIVPDISAHPQNRDGCVTRNTFESFVNRNDLRPGDAVLCRNNAPLVNTALLLLRHQVPCKIVGRGKFGSQLKGLVDSIRTTSLRALRRHLCHRIQLALEEGWEGDAVDRALSLIALVDSLPHGTISDLRNLLISLFEAPEGPRCITLSTIHKAKGLEWDRVFLIGNEKYLNLESQGQTKHSLQQERNLLYVGITRAREQLCFVSAPESEFSLDL